MVTHRQSSLAGGNGNTYNPDNVGFLVPILDDLCWTETLDTRVGNI